MYVLVIVCSRSGGGGVSIERIMFKERDKALRAQQELVRPYSDLDIKSFVIETDTDVQPGLAR